MEAYRIADRQRTRLVGKNEHEWADNLNSQKVLQNQMLALNKNLDSLQKQVENLYWNIKSFPANNANPNFSHQNAMHNTRNQQTNRAGFGRFAGPPAHRNQNIQGNNTFRWNKQSRGDKSSRNQHFSNQNQNRQGNFHQSNQGSGFRLN